MRKLGNPTLCFRACCILRLCTLTFNTVCVLGWLSAEFIFVLKVIILSEIFIYFLTNSGPILTQTQILTFKLTPCITQTLTQIQNLTPKNVNKKSTNEYFSLLHYFL